MSGELFALAIAAGVVLFLLRRAWRRPPGPPFRGPFTPHIAVQLTLRRGVTVMQGRQRGVFAAGRNGFTVRFDVPGVLEPGAPQRVEAQFLKPEMALAHFSAGTVFSLLDAARVVADGEVIEILRQNEAHEPGQGRRPPV